MEKNDTDDKILCRDCAMIKGNREKNNCRPGQIMNLNNQIH